MIWKLVLVQVLFTTSKMDINAKKQKEISAKPQNCMRSQPSAKFLLQKQSSNNMKFQKFQKQISDFLGLLKLFIS